jgi:hypothetical protein
VGAEIGEVLMAADMVPVNMGGGGRYRLVRQFYDFIMNIADSKSRINQQASLRPVQEVAVGFLPVAVFADGEGIIVYFVNCEPVIHKNASFRSIAGRIRSRFPRRPQGGGDQTTTRPVVKEWSE